jgi:hypothetical protein
LELYELVHRELHEQPDVARVRSIPQRRDGTREKPIPNYSNYQNTGNLKKALRVKSLTPNPEAPQQFLKKNLR